MNYRSTIAILSLFALMLVGSPAQAQRGRNISSKACPYSCESAGLSRSECRDWKSRNRCYVENLSKSRAPTPKKHGYVTYGRCPHSCSTAGLSRSQCSDWQKGSTCYVEDFTRAPTAQPVPIHTPRLPDPPLTYDPNPHRGNRGYQQDRPHRGSIGDRYDHGGKACHRLNRLKVSAPRVDIHKIKRSGNFFSDKYRVYGSVEGRCIVEAALFEDGRKVRSIPIDTSPDFDRFEFNVQIDKSDYPELRVYNVFGDRDIFYIFEDNDRRHYDNNRRPYSR